MSINSVFSIFSYKFNLKIGQINRVDEDVFLTFFLYEMINKLVFNRKSLDLNSIHNIQSNNIDISQLNSKSYGF